MKAFLKYLLVALVALGSASAPAAFWQWSKTSATNSQVDPSINWTGGMSPSGVDPSGRAMMARVAEYRDDISGALATGGTATAYTVTTNQSTGGTLTGLCGAGSTPTDGQLVAITPNNTNGASATLAVDTCTARAIQSAPGVAAPVGTLVSGTPYSLKYSTSNTAWMLREFFGNPYSVALGGLLPTTINAVPNSNFILPAGQCISTTTFATYWALLGSPAPGGCGAGTFAVIDMRGRVPVALDNLNGTAASRMTSSASGCGVAFTAIGTLCGSQSQTTTLAQLPTGIVVANGSQAITASGPSGHNFYALGSYTNVGNTSGGSYTGPANSLSAATNNSFAFSGSNSVSMTSNNTGGAAHANVMPTIAVAYLLRVI
jgi:microcystin-dependent protein